jgi:SAM-dependent methyltransferase
MRNDGEDFLSALDEVVKSEPAFLRGLEGKLNTTIDSRDGMFSGHLEHYAKCGRSALDLLELSLSQSNGRKEKVKRILDFGCGFGRVTRWLAAAFTKAEIVAIDVDPKAVQAVKDLLKIRAQQICRDWTDLPRERFDIIWIGSLCTHLDEKRCAVLLTKLYKLLEPNGIIAVTTHGAYVETRLRGREKTYGLTEYQIGKLLDEYHSSSFGFVEYSEIKEYGISLAKPQRVFELMVGANLRPIIFLERGWIRHQDFFAAKPEHG